MANETAKADLSAEKAYAAAAEAAPVAAPAAPVKAAKPAAKKAAPKKPVAKPAAARKAPANAKPAPQPAAATAQPKPVSKPLTKPITAKFKDNPMSKTPDFMKSITDAMSEAQARAKAAYDKSTVLAGEASDFAKGNVEAMVEAGKILTTGMQDLGKTYAEEAKSAYETATADMKEIAAIKSPTELFQLQGKLARRNFDALVAFSSKSSEAMLKLANDSMAPLSSRMSLAADTLSKVA